jgi:hypothetical protein
MRKILFSLACALAIAGAAPPAADAATYKHSGQMCRFWGIDGVLQRLLVAASWGVENRDGSIQETECPVTNKSTTIDVESGRVWYEDRKNGTAFSCSLRLRTDTNSYVSPTKYSCATSPNDGCSTNSDPAYQGTGSLTFGNPFSSLTSVRTLYFACVIPGTGSGGYQYSSVRSYEVTLVGG